MSDDRDGSLGVTYSSEEEDQHDRRSFAAATVAIALILGEVAFQYGTSGSVFYTRFLVMAILGIVAFVSTFVAAEPTRGRTWIVRVICILPLLALLSLATDDYDSPLVSVGQLAVVASVPFVLGVLALIFGVDVRELPRRLQIMSLATILVVGIGSYAIGVNHAVFFSCDQFVEAGANTPEDCFNEISE